MANIKISSLPSATTPLAGTEVLPIVQSSETRQVSVANLTLGRSVSSTGLIVTANSATDAVRITQLGAGNALLVEDSANPDASPFVVDSAGNVGIGTTLPVVKLDISATDAVRIPVGTTGQRPTGVNGYLRFNSTTSEFEGYNGTAWAAVGGGGTAPQLIATNGLVVNSNTVAASYSIPAGFNAMSTGPITVASGQAVTVPSGSRWVVL